MSDFREHSVRQYQRAGKTVRAHTSHHKAAEPKVDLTATAASTSRKRPEGWTGLAPVTPVITAPRTAKPAKPQSFTVTHRAGAVITQSRPRTRAEKRRRDTLIESQARMLADLSLDEMLEAERAKGREARREWLSDHDLGRWLREWAASTRLARFLLEEHGLGGLAMDGAFVRFASWFREAPDAADIGLANSNDPTNRDYAYRHLRGAARDRAVAEARALRIPEHEISYELEDREFEVVTMKKERRRIKDPATGKLAWRNVEVTETKTVIAKAPRLYPQPEEDDDEYRRFLDEATAQADLMDWGMKSDSAARAASRLGYYKDPASVYDADQKALDEQRLASARSWLEANR